MQLNTTIRMHYSNEFDSPERIDFCDKSIHTYNIVLDGNGIYHVYQGEYYRCSVDRNEFYRDVIPEIT